MRWSSCFVALLLASFLALPMNAQVSPAGTPQEPEPALNAPPLKAPTLKAESRAVVVDVIVTTGDGQPVKGLTKEDFHLTEDGREQPIAFFEEHAAPTLAPSSAPAAPSPTPPNVFSNAKARPSSDVQTVLLLDALNTPKQEQSYVRERVIEYLNALQPGTPLSIFALGSKLRLVQGSTASSATLLAAFEDKKTGVWPETSAPSRNPQDEVDSRANIEFLNSMNSAPPGSIQAVQQAQANQSAYQGDQRVAITVAAMQAMGRYLGGIPGRKNLIWFSSSFPIALFPAPGMQISSKATEQNRALKDAADLLAAARVAIYPVNAQGVGAPGLGDATDHYGSSGDGLAQENAASAVNSAAMGGLAAATGGQVIPNTNDLAMALTRVVQNGASYYTLSYDPTNRKIDGKFRRIEVRVNAGDYRLAYRRGYYALPSYAADVPAKAAPPSDPLQSLLQFGMPDATELPFDVRVQTASSGATQVPRYNLDFTIRWTDDSAEAAAANGGHSGRIRMELVAYDSSGKTLSAKAGIIKLDLTASQYATVQRSGLHSHFDFDVPAGTTYLAAGVYDLVSNKAGSLQIPLKGLQLTPEAAPAAEQSSSVAEASLPSAAPATPAAKGLIPRTPAMAEDARKAARHITLDVRVTDAAGKAVGGLAQRDFTVMDNARAQPIASFREVEGRTAKPPVEVVLVLDTMNSRFEDVAVERQGMEKFLRQNGGHLAYPVSILFLTDSGAKLDQPSRDGDGLAADVEKLQTPVRVIGASQGLSGLMERSRLSLRTMEQLLDYEATRPGRKLLLWVGPGWPLLAGQSFHLSATDQRRSFASIVDFSTKLREARVTLYSVPPLDLSAGNPLRASAYQEYLRGVENSRQAESADLAVQVLAYQSGGQALDPGVDIAAGIARCVEDANLYYEISFDTSPGKDVNEYHGLKVVVDRAGLMARTNTGYYAQP